MQKFGIFILTRLLVDVGRGMDMMLESSSFELYSECAENTLKSRKTFSDGKWKRIKQREDQECKTTNKFKKKKIQKELQKG